MREMFWQVVERPGPALVALAIGLAIGLGVKGLTASEDSPSAAAPVEPAPERSEPLPKPEPKPEPEPEPKPAGGDSQERIFAALDAVESYASRQGEARVGAAIVPLDGSEPVHSAGVVPSGRPWSVMKVPAAAAYLNFKRDSQGAASGESTIPPGSLEREGLGDALVQSDNLAIRRRVQEMIDEIGNDATAAAINETLEAGGSAAQISPAIDPTIDSLQLGTGTWALSEAAQWFWDLQAGEGECLGLARDDRIFILRQLRAAPTALSWGAASVLDQGSIALKPGWGSEGGEYTVEQAVIVGNGSEQEGFPSLDGGYVMVLMAVLPSSDPSAFVAGQQQLAELASLIDAEMGTPGPGREDQAPSC